MSTPCECASEGSAESRSCSDDECEFACGLCGHSQRLLSVVKRAR